jgi:hypothetical protein
MPDERTDIGSKSLLEEPMNEELSENALLIQAASSIQDALSQISKLLINQEENR